MERTVLTKEMEKCIKKVRCGICNEQRYADWVESCDMCKELYRQTGDIRFYHKSLICIHCISENKALRTTTIDGIRQIILHFICYNKRSLGIQF